MSCREPGSQSTVPSSERSFPVSICERNHFRQHPVAPDFSNFEWETKADNGDRRGSSTDKSVRFKEVHVNVTVERYTALEILIHGLGMTVPVSTMMNRAAES